MKRNIRQLVMMLVGLLLAQSAMSMGGQTQSVEQDRAYLLDVYKATFTCLDYFTSKESGFPYDVSTKKKETSISNIGLYMATVAVAGKTGLLEEAQAVEKLTKNFAYLNKIKKWKGFPVTWVDADTAEMAYGPKFSYADHNGNLISGLLVVAGLYPEQFAAQVEAFIKPMDFVSTFDQQKKMIKGGYDLSKNDFDVKQSWGDWYYSILASDTRHFGLLGMARGELPESYWNTLTRHTNLSNPIDKEMSALLKTQNKKYMWPGIEGGGLFMQYLPGIFLNEKGLVMHESASNMALGEIELAKANGYYPIWGISAAETPDGKGYLGWGTLEKTVVTPHASMLAVEDFPSAVVGNLKALEAKGMRPKQVIDGKTYDFGFTDSYDVLSGEAAKRYLSLDQAMAFLSLANFLHDNIVRKAFSNTKLGEKTQKVMEKMESGKKM